MVTLRARGAARFFAAAFLGLWLCGWAAGEGFAIWLLANGVSAMMSGTALGSGPIRLQTGPVIAMGGFLLLWLAIWTLGGIAAMTEFFRLICGEDRLLAEGGGLTVVHLRGPFHTRHEYPRDSLRRFVITGRGALVVETRSQTVELSRLGTREEREAAPKALRRDLGMSDVDPAAAAAPAALPKGWEEIITPEGERAVVPDHSMRRVQARIAGLAALGAASAAAAVIQESLRKPGLLPFAIQLVLGAIVLVCVTVWLARGRMEWRIGSGRVTLRRRFGPGVRDIFEAQGLELALAHDRSDNYDTFALDAVSDLAGTPSALPSSPGAAKKRKRITAVVRDPVVPRQLGAYLAKAGNVTFLDRTTLEARAAEMTVVKDRLEKSARLGPFKVRLVVKTKERKQA